MPKSEAPFCCIDRWIVVLSDPPYRETHAMRRFR
jgi:hypothetical protein